MKINLSKVFPRQEGTGEPGGAWETRSPGQPQTAPIPPCYLVASRASHSRLPGRLTRGFQGVSLEIPGSGPPFVKNRFFIVKSIFFKKSTFGKKSIEKIMKISKFYFGPGSPKNRFLRFFWNFFTKKWAGNLGISSETTWESRVRRPGPRL